MNYLEDISGFKWDDGNATKNWESHQVTRLESEQMFSNEPLVVVPGLSPSPQEERFAALGRTDQGRLLFVVFTVREHMVRVISARDMSRKERRVYQDAESAT